jgi:butyrate kinase
VAYLGTNDFRKVNEIAANGDPKAALIIDGAVYQIAKEIGAMAAVLKGDIDGVILTGGMAYQESFVDKIILMIGFLSKVYVYPGEDEIKSLAFNGLLALDGKIGIKTYK